MKKSTTETLHELKDFVKYQALVDAGLPSSEKRYQAKLVADVLGQETPNGQALKELLDLYHTEKQAA